MPDPERSAAFSLGTIKAEILAQGGEELATGKYSGARGIWLREALQDLGSRLDGIQGRIGDPGARAELASELEELRKVWQPWNEKLPSLNKLDGVITHLGGDARFGPESLAGATLPAPPARTFEPDLSRANEAERRQAAVLTLRRGFQGIERELLQVGVREPGISETATAAASVLKQRMFEVERLLKRTPGEQGVALAIDRLQSLRQDSLGWRGRFVQSCRALDTAVEQLGGDSTTFAVSRRTEPGARSDGFERASSGVSGLAGQRHRGHTADPATRMQQIAAHLGEHHPDRVRLRAALEAIGGELQNRGGYSPRQAADRLVNLYQEAPTGEVYQALREIQAELFEQSLQPGPARLAGGSLPPRFAQPQGAFSRQVLPTPALHRERLQPGDREVLQAQRYWLNPGAADRGKFNERLDQLIAGAGARPDLERRLTALKARGNALAEDEVAPRQASTQALEIIGELDRLAGDPVNYNIRYELYGVIRAMGGKFGSTSPVGRDTTGQEVASDWNFRWKGAQAGGG